MKALVADDDRFARQVVQNLLETWGYEVVATAGGTEAWTALAGDDPPSIVVLDWMMPDMSGAEICAKIRERGRPAYVILVTAKSETEDVVAGLAAGADDYLKKPFEPQELRARIDVGRRVLLLQQQLADRVQELERALAEVKQLGRLLPICCYCKKIRDDQNYWEHLETYITEHSEAQFSHSICPDCFAKHVKPGPA